MKWKSNVKCRIMFIKSYCRVMRISENIIRRFQIHTHDTCSSAMIYDFTSPNVNSLESRDMKTMNYGIVTPILMLN